MENQTITKPTIVKRIEQTEVNEVSRLLSECHILPVSLVKAFLIKKGKTENQIENILNQLVKKKLGYYDESKEYLKINKSFSLSSINPGLVKSIWLMLDLINNIEEYFVQTKNPHTLTFFNMTAERKGLHPVYDVFYIPYGREQLDCYVMNELANASDDALNSFIIVDSKEQVNRINLSEKVSVASFVLIDSSGKVEYFSE